MHRHVSKPHCRISFFGKNLQYSSVILHCKIILHLGNILQSVLILSYYNANIIYKQYY